MTNAIGTPLLLLCAQGRYSVGSGCCRHVDVERVVGDADDRDRRLVGRAPQEDLADRIGALQERIGEPLADDRDLRAVGDVLIGEGAAAQHLECASS